METTNCSKFCFVFTIIHNFNVSLPYVSKIKNIWIHVYKSFISYFLNFLSICASKMSVCSMQYLKQQK